VGKEHNKKPTLFFLLKRNASRSALFESEREACYDKASFVRRRREDDLEIFLKVIFYGDFISISLQMIQTKIRTAKRFG
jgi:hypothetical protein